MHFYQNYLIFMLLHFSFFHMFMSVLHQNKILNLLFCFLFIFKICPDYFLYEISDGNIE